MIGEVLHILEKFRGMLHHMARDEAVKIIRQEYGVHSGIFRLKQNEAGESEWTMVQTTMKGHKKNRLENEFIDMLMENHGIVYMPVKFDINEKPVEMMGLYVRTTEHMILFLAIDEEKRKRIEEKRERMLILRQEKEGQGGDRMVKRVLGEIREEDREESVSDLD